MRKPGCGCQYGKCCDNEKCVPYVYVCEPARKTKGQDIANAEEGAHLDAPRSLFDVAEAMVEEIEKW